VAESLRQFADVLENCEGDFDSCLHDLIRETIKKHKRILFNGNGYDDALLAILNDAPTEGNVSVGINNLKRRCMFLYDKDTQYAFYNDGGAVSDIFLPWTQRE
ncbi:MAG: hypothetical protein J5973_04600, partial [Eubacterium sp.]|nr:hypothetical protein [Eubacterium sp.]